MKKHNILKIRTLAALTALLMSFTSLTVTKAETTEVTTTSEETTSQETTTKKPKASAKFKNKNISFYKSKSKTAVLIIKNLKVEKINTAVKNNKATIKSIEIKEKEDITTIKVKLAGNSTGKDKLTVTLTTDTGRKVTRRCNINITAPAPKKETPKKESKDDIVYKNDAGGYMTREQQEAAFDLLDEADEELGEDFNIEVGD